MKPITHEEQLAKMRQGRDADLKIVVGGLEIPCRILPSREEATVIANAKLKVNVPAGVDPALFVSDTVMKAVLSAACCVKNTPYINEKFLAELSSDELVTIYDEYVTICKTVNPKFESLSKDELGELIIAVKKKERSTNDLYTYQLAAIGKYFLDQVLPKVSEAGS